MLHTRWLGRTVILKGGNIFSNTHQEILMPFKYPFPSTYGLISVQLLEGNQKSVLNGRKKYYFPMEWCYEIWVQTTKRPQGHTFLFAFKATPLCVNPTHLTLSKVWINKLFCLLIIRAKHISFTFYITRSYKL